MRSRFLALAALLVACGQPQASLTVDPASGPATLRGHYTEGGVTIGFEALRVVDADGEGVVDARFFDAGERTFLLAVGGHRPADAAWELSAAELPPGEREAAFALVEPAVRELESTLQGEFAEELRALRGLAEAQAQTDAELAPADRRAPPGAIVCDTGYNHAISVRWKYVSALMQNLCPGGQHSATRMCSYRIYSNCSQATYGCKYQDNHGTSWKDMTNNSCSWKSGLRSSAYPPYQACLTLYGVHVCNDDSLLQIHNVKNNSSYPVLSPSGYCDPGWLRCKAPSC